VELGEEVLRVEHSGLFWTWEGDLDPCLRRCACCFLTFCGLYDDVTIAFVRCI